MTLRQKYFASRNYFNFSLKIVTEWTVTEWTFNVVIVKKTYYHLVQCSVLTRFY